MRISFSTENIPYLSRFSVNLSLNEITRYCQIYERFALISIIFLVCSVLIHLHVDYSRCYIFIHLGSSIEDKINRSNPLESDQSNSGEFMHCIRIYLFVDGLQNSIEANI